MFPARKTLFVASVLTAWFASAAFLAYNRTELADDLAEYVNNPVRLLDGERPYRDFWLLHPPGEVYLPAAVYRLGLGVNAVLLMSAAISVLTGLAAFWVGRMSSGGEVDGALAALLVFFAGVPVESVGCVYLHAYLLCLLVAAGLLAGYLESHRPRRLFWAGLALGCGLCFKVYLTGAAVAAVLVIVALESRHRKSAWRETGGLLVTCGMGVLIVPAVVSVLLADVWPQMCHALLIDAVSHAVTRRLHYGFFVADAWDEFTRAAVGFWSAPAENFARLDAPGSDLVKTATMHGVPFLAIFLWGLRRRNGAAVAAATEWMIFFFLLWGGLTFVRPLLRGGHPHQLSQATTPLYLALVLLFRPIAAGWRAKRSLMAGLAYCALLGTVAGLGQRAIFMPLQRVAAACRKESYTVVAPYGTLVAADRSRAGELQELIAAVLEHTTAEDHIFVVPWNAPALYALTRRRNSTYYDSTIDLFYRPAPDRERQVCQDLLANDTRLVIGRADLPGPGWDRMDRPSQLTIIDGCISEHFEQMCEIGRFRVYQRRAGVNNAR
jgi:putative effector of murein hydrolase LrgA (UPF0299 family)